MPVWILGSSLFGAELAGALTELEAILLADARAALERQVLRLGGQNDLLEAFAAWVSPAIALSVGAVIGVIRTSPSDPLPQRLGELQIELRALIAELAPDVVAVERIFFQNNVRTAMSVGQASGIAMAEGASAGCTVVEYSPNQVKEAVAGHDVMGRLSVDDRVEVGPGAFDRVVVDGKVGVPLGGQPLEQPRRGGPQGCRDAIGRDCDCACIARACISIPIPTADNTATVAATATCARVDT